MHWTRFLFASSMTVTTRRLGDGTIIVSNRKPSALIVLSHGLGDTAEGWLDVAESMAKEMDHLKIVLPTAPTQPVTLNGGMPMPSWYDIVGLDERSNENCPGIEDSQQTLTSLLSSEGLPYSRMMLAGFSQGGALSLYTGLQLPEALAGILVFSGYLPKAAAVQVAQPSVPVWHGHGLQDFVVAYSMAEKSHHKLLELGVQDYTLHSYPIAHTVTPSELTDARAFLQRVLPDDPSACKDPTQLSVKQLKTAIQDAGANPRGLLEKSELVAKLQELYAAT